jgi:hypothetical protein
MPIKASSAYSKKYVKNLYSSGLAAQLTFGKNVLNKETDKKFQLRQHIIDEIKSNGFDQSKFDFEVELLNLFKLLCFIQAWSDPEETWINANDEGYRKKRQQMKFKKDINKSTRRLIHLGLFKLVYESLWQFKHATSSAKNVGEIEFFERLLESFEQPSTETNETKKFKKEYLINAINKILKNKDFTRTRTPENIKENFSEAAKLISAFSLKSNKLFYACGIGLGLIAALACGLSTGGAIFVLLLGFSLPLGFVIPLSLLIFLAGTRANFQLFSQHIPQFFQDLCKNGGGTEFIDQQGKRLQLSGSKKFLLLPAGFLSLSVGIAAAAITYLEGTKMIALICPMLAATCPHLTVALLGILASVLLIGLTIVMFRTFIGVLQSQFSWQGIKKDIKEKWHNLNCTQGLGYVFKVLIMVAAFFGLAYLDFTGTTTLAGLLDWAAADAITLAAIIGDLPFTLKTALAWCNSLFKSNSNPNSDLQKDIVYYFWKTIEFLALIVNALGNAALVFTDSCLSRIASIACFMNSYACNRIQDDDNELNQARAKATQESLDALKCTFFRQSSPDTQIPKEAINDETLTGNCSTGLSKAAFEAL